MAKVEGGIWTLAILVVYTFFFLGITSLINAQATVLGSVNPYTTATNPGFDSRLNPFLITESCSGKGEVMNFFGGLPCTRLDIDAYDYHGCGNISGCDWKNQTSLFGIAITDAGCYDFVNKTYYNITTNKKQDYCKSSGLQEENLCNTFRCTWLNISSQFASVKNTDNLYMPTVTLWESVFWVITFQIDLGWGQFNWIVSFFFYMLLILLILALYYTFAPF